jgi:hypothetical protein
MHAFLKSIRLRPNDVGLFCHGSKEDPFESSLTFILTRHHIFISILSMSTNPSLDETPKPFDIFLERSQMSLVAYRNLTIISALECHLSLYVLPLNFNWLRKLDEDRLKS